MSATLKADEELKEEGEDLNDEIAQIRQYEKTVNIRFGNFSMLVRANAFGINSKLLALLAGYGNTGKDKPLLDASEGSPLGGKESSGWD